MPIDDCFNSLKTLLAYTETNLTTNLPASRSLDRILGTATELLSGHYAKLAPFYEPLTPAFMAAVGSVNRAIVNGDSSADTFNDYVGLILAELNS
jgi:hypothetical protein